MELFWVAAALLGAGVQLTRERKNLGGGRAAEILLLWWLGLAVGVDGIVSGLFHIFDGPGIAEQIGFTQGDGGFHTEVGVADIALGTIALLSVWFRGGFMLAAIIALAISHFGDAAGHIYQWRHNDNTAADNVGVPLFYGIVAPLIAIGLYAWYARSPRGTAEPELLP